MQCLHSAILTRGRVCSADLGLSHDGSVLVSFADDKSIKPDVQQCRLIGQAHRYALWLACGHPIRMTEVPHQWLNHELLLHSIKLT